MSKKKKHAEHANHERWLVSYADFITLLFAFFVVLFSSSQVDRSKTNKMALAIEAAFSRFSIFSKGGGNLSLISTDGTPNTTMSTVIPGAEGSPIFMPPAVLGDDMGIIVPELGDPSLNQGAGMPTSEEEALRRAKQDIFSLLNSKKVEGASMAEVNHTMQGLVITLNDDVLFSSGSDHLTPASAEVLKEIGEIIRHMPNQVRINGHTDNKRGKGAFGSNWELSGARATQLVKWFLSNFNMDPSRFAAVGYGEFRPLASNDTEEGRRQNRRVEIVLLTSKAAESEEGRRTPQKGVDAASGPQNNSSDSEEVPSP